MFHSIITITIILFSIYNFLPTLYNRFFNQNIIKKLDSNSIYLTFDDGPDIVYTNKLLDILDKYNIKATFFLVAIKANKNKNIVKKIINEGHSVGLHSYEHKNSWFMTQTQTKNDFLKSLDISNQFEYDIYLYRPTWGLFNIFTNHYSSSHNLKTILWTKSFKDWKEQTSVDYIVNNATENIKPGDILLFHDSGGDKFAPENTLLALDKLIPILLKKGYSFDKI